MDEKRGVHGRMILVFAKNDGDILAENNSNKELKIKTGVEI